MVQTLLVIDTERGFVDRLAQKLDDEELADRYSVRQIVPDTTLDRPIMVERCVQEVERLIATAAVAVVFVDIVVIESAAQQLDMSGIAIAKAVRQRQAAVPICFVTGHFMTEVEATALSEASLQDVEGVLVKSYLIGEHFVSVRQTPCLTGDRPAT